MKQDLKNLKMLKVIRFLNNKIKIIYMHTFKFNKKLEKIDLIGNEIIHIEPSAFHGLRHLKIIDLRGNICISKKSKRGEAKKFYSEIQQKCFNSSISDNLNTEENLDKKSQNGGYLVKLYSNQFIVLQIFLIFVNNLLN